MRGFLASLYRVTVKSGLMFDELLGVGGSEVTIRGQNDDRQRGIQQTHRQSVFDHRILRL
jgi:hypothetical protein